MDLMVLKTQQYLNRIYGNNAGYNTVVEDGLTGWATIYALTRALQIELGISSTADNFGNATKEAFEQRFPNGVVQQSNADTTTSRIYAIIQGALWCKGYSTGASGITEHFYGGTGAAVMQLKEDAGLLNPNSTVTLNVMKGLLSMDQYKCVSIGSDSLRTVQQKLNQKYESYIGLIPCDGLYGRGMNKALIIVLQAILNLTADGVFGNGTKAACPILPDDNATLTTLEAEELANLVRYALYCNGYDISIYDTGWDTDIEYYLREFQNDLKLTVTGKVDIDTWMSLLLSKGNPDRACSACDTRFEITTSRANELKAKGYNIVGRYLTGTTFKVLRDDEPQRIIDNGLYFFPIFQESSTNVSYFTEERAILDAENAVRAARKFGIPEGNVIYYAVDLDATEAQIENYILPYFSTLYQYADTAYKIGVYGTRNVCTQVCEWGYAVTCFVSDMSTGYSGNMGFKMPSNWNFDQFAEIAMNASSDGQWAIDKDAYSGRFAPVTELDSYKYIQPQKTVVPEYPRIFDVIPLIEMLEDLYVAWYTPLFNAAPTVVPYLSPSVLAEGITRFLRSIEYNNALWQTSLSASEEGFINYVKQQNEDLYSALSFYMKSEDEGGLLLSDGNGGVIDFKHLAATSEGYFTNSILPDSWYGWGADLATAILDIEAVASNFNNIRDAADFVIGNSDYSFSYEDICVDADAIKIAELINTSSSTTHSFSEALSDYYENYVQNRFEYYLSDIGCNTSLTSIKENLVDNLNVILPMVALLYSDGMHDYSVMLSNIPSSSAFNEGCAAFAKYIYCELE